MARTFSTAFLAICYEEPPDTQPGRPKRRRKRKGDSTATSVFNELKRLGVSSSCINNWAEAKNLPEAREFEAILRVSNNLDLPPATVNAIREMHKTDWRSHSNRHKTRRPKPDPNQRSFPFADPVEISDDTASLRVETVRKSDKTITIEITVAQLK